MLDVFIWIHEAHSNVRTFARAVSAAWDTVLLIC